MKSSDICWQLSNSHQDKSGGCETGFGKAHAMQPIHSNLPGNVVRVCMIRLVGIVILKKSVISDTHLRITYTCISIFSNIGLVHLSKPYTQTYLQKVISCIHLELPIVILKRHASSYNVHVYKFSAKSG